MRLHNDHNLPGHFEMDEHDRPTRWVPAMTEERTKKALRLITLEIVCQTIMILAGATLVYYALRWLT